jgi:hypothetical protein
MSFLQTPLALTVDEFRDYVATKHWHGWRPQFMVLHNTAEPSLAQWEHYGLGKTAAVQRARNLNHYYANYEGWHSGPQIFVAPDFIIVACDLEAYGVHASCYNTISIGLEMVGNYEVEDFHSGLGAKVRDNAVAALAILHHALGIDPSTLHFHRQCIRDHHACPGKNVDQADVIARVKAAMGGHSAPAAAAPAKTVTISGEVVSSAQLAVAKKINAFFVGKLVPIAMRKLLSVHAAGFVAQAWGESRLDPYAWGDHREAYGLFQFHGDRLGNACRALKFTKPTPPILGQTRGLNDLPVDKQLEVAWWDLTEPELHHLIEIANTKTAKDAGQLACSLWERAGAGGAAERRGVWAQEWLSALALSQ